MCRLFLFISHEKPLNLKYVINDSFNSLKNQSFQQPYLPELDETNKYVKKRNPRTHMDGFGLAYKLNKKYKIFKTKKPIVDKNLKIRKEILENIKNYDSNFILAYIRRSNNINKNCLDDTQPFIYKNNYFLHNGQFSEYFNEIIQDLIGNIKKKFLLKIGFNMDSKLLFCLLLSNLTLNKTITFQKIYKEIIYIINIFNKCSQGKKFNISLNFIFANIFNKVYLAIRYRTGNEMAPSLYFNKDYNEGIAISSEPIDINQNWTLLNNQIVIIIGHEYQIFNIN